MKSEEEFRPTSFLIKHTYKNTYMYMRARACVCAIFKIGYKSLGDLMKLTVTQPQVKDHQPTLTWKTLKEININYSSK